MITEELRYRIYGLALIKDDITTKQLTELGLKSHDIRKLVKEGTLTRIEIGHYKFTGVELLYDYALSLLSKARSENSLPQKDKYITLANSYFKKCHELDSKNREVNLYLLFHFIATNNYNKANELLETMYDIDDEEAIKENNLFLYLLSCYGVCPLSLYKRISSIDCDDLALIGWSNDIDRLIISKIYAQQFDEARELISNLVVKNSSTRVKKNILMNLLKKPILNVSFADLRAVLKENKVEEFYKLLRVYLRIIGREEYELLISWLTKLCILDGDFTFDMVFRELVELEKADYNDVTAVFIRDFYQYVADEKYKQASICFKIIKKYGNVSPEIIDSLSSKLPHAKGSAKNTSSDSVSDDGITYDKVKEELAGIIKTMQVDGELVHVISEVSSEYKDFALRIFRERGLGNEFKNIKFWCFNLESPTIVLRLIDPNIWYIDIGKKLKSISYFFDTKQYSKCIKCIEELLKYRSFDFLTLEKARTLFYYLAQSYIFNGQYNNKNRKYFALVTALNSALPKDKQQESYDFTEKIAKLTENKAKLHRNNKANGRIARASAILPPREEIKWEGFFGINAISEEVAIRLAGLQDILYTSIELGKSLEEVAREYNLAEEDILLMGLIKTRDYYIEDLHEEGNNELRKVSLSSNKTPLIDALIQEILIHRFDYRRMSSNYSKKRVLLESSDNKD